MQIIHCYSPSMFELLGWSGWSSYLVIIQQVWRHPSFCSQVGTCCMAKKTSAPATNYGWQPSPTNGWENPMFSPQLGDWSWWISRAGGLYRLVKHDRKRPCFALWKSAERARLRKADWIFSPSHCLENLKAGINWSIGQRLSQSPTSIHWEWGLRLFLTEKDLFRNLMGLATQGSAWLIRSFAHSFSVFSFWHIFQNPHVFFWTFYSGILTLYILIFHLRFRCNSFDFIFVLRSNNSKHSTLHNSEDFVCLHSFSISGIPTLRRYYEIRISP